MMVQKRDVRLLIIIDSSRRRMEGVLITCTRKGKSYQKIISFPCIFDLLVILLAGKITPPRENTPLKSENSVGFFFFAFARHLQTAV
jgi:hypothetical protein